LKEPSGLQDGRKDQAIEDRGDLIGRDIAPMLTTRRRTDDPRRSTRVPHMKRSRTVAAVAREATFPCGA
jgi:hypothetical protein